MAKYVRYVTLFVRFSAIYYIFHQLARFTELCFLSIFVRNKKEFISVINQLDAQNVCFIISLFHASTCFEHMCSSSGRQNCIMQPLVSSHL